MKEPVVQFTFGMVHAALRAVGVTLSRPNLAGEYRVNMKGSVCSRCDGLGLILTQHLQCYRCHGEGKIATEDTAYYTDDLSDAYYTGMAMSGVSPEQAGVESPDSTDISAWEGEGGLVVS